ncbi:histidine phosphatase family protein [Ruegeria sp.]|uniref:histidine phosphatase family protein n=1 Tax=Ruegeria sp. TaxID=1879320 RepID=UPI003C79BB0C
MGQYPDLYILRHGETKWNTLGKFQGHKNSPLTETGKAQARMQNKILDRLPNCPPDAFVSPQERAMHTAQIALPQHVSKQTDDRLMEIAFGQWEGATKDYIRSQITCPYDSYQWFFQSPGGESFEMIAQRAQSFLANLKTPTLVVTHGVTSMVLRGLWLGLDLNDLLKLSRTQGCVFHLSNETETILT